VATLNLDNYLNNTNYNPEDIIISTPHIILRKIDQNGNLIIKNSTSPVIN
jgi:hypothetical protein